jgi:hypothetical protein
MIEVVFTIDYEIYGNGDGSLKDLVLDPATGLKAMFDRRGLKFVTFVEVAELEIIELNRADAAIGEVRRQIKTLHENAFEIGLHLHPQWYNARREDGRWILDHDEYNLCNLPAKRISDIVDRSLAYLRDVLSEPGFVPLSFRAGNWLFQPSATAAKAIAERGIKVDSSVFKGGLQRARGLDYRRAVHNGYYWTFSEHVDIPDSTGGLLEIPTYTQMVPFWRMLTTKRIGMSRKRPGSGGTGAGGKRHLLDLLRFRYPLKLDFCRMTLAELVRMMDSVIAEDRKIPDIFRPIVAIGHTKDLVDYDTVQSFLDFLKSRGIAITTFASVRRRCLA